MRAGAVSVALLVAATTLGGCRKRVPAMPGEAMTSWSARLSLAISRDGDWRRAKGFLAVDPPDRLRLELHDPVGRTRLTLLVSDGPSRLLLDDTYADGASGTELLGRLLACPERCRGDTALPPRDVVEVVLGRRGSEGVLPSGPRYRIEERDGDGRPTVIRLDPDEKVIVSLSLSEREPLGEAEKVFALPATRGRRFVPQSEVGHLWDDLEESP